MLLERAGVDLAELLSVSFDDAHAVRQFIRETGFTAVFTGHLHETRRDLAGKVPVYCSGQAGYEDGEPLAYRLIGVDGAKVRVATKRVDPASL